MHSPEEFEKAVRDYGFPVREPITGFPEEVSDPTGPTRLRAVYREAQETSDCYRHLPAFWASALFNFLEDAGLDHRYEEIGASGSYRAIDANEGPTDADVEAESSGAIRDVVECYVAHRSGGLSSFTGRDRDGMFALISLEMS